MFRGVLLKLAVAVVAMAFLASYLSAASHRAASPSPGHAGQVAVAYAEKQLGKPYMWGGPTMPGTSGGFDCSGLVMMAYRAAGISIPRTSQKQWASLPHISRSQLKPGDLVFAAGADGTLTSPGHVVMYIGHGKVIQAFATGYPVMVSSLASVSAAGATGYARPTA